MELMRLVEELAIPVHLGCTLEEVTDTTVVCRTTETAERVEFPADTVLLAVGMAARLDVADALRRSAPETEVFVVGDAAESGEHRHGGQVGASRPRPTSRNLILVRGARPDDAPGGVASRPPARCRALA